MLDKKLIDKINRLLETRTFSVQSDFLRMEENMTVDFKFKILGTTNLFHMGIEKEYVLLEVYLPFELHGNALKDRVFTILQLGSKNEYNYQDFAMFNSLSYIIEKYIEDVLSWFGIKNRVKVEKIKLINQ